MAAIICDTRQQAGKHEHVDRWFERHGVDFEYRKLDFGDYMTEGSNVSVDTKKDMAELASNLGKDHARFVRECERARSVGHRLIILVEAGDRYNDAAEVARWLSPVCLRCRRCNPREAATRCTRFKRKPMQGRQLLSIMAGMEKNHGVWFSFCDRRKTARTICELLGVAYEPTE